MNIKSGIALFFALIPAASIASASETIRSSPSSFRQQTAPSSPGRCRLINDVFMRVGERGAPPQRIPIEDAVSDTGCPEIKDHSKVLQAYFGARNPAISFGILQMCNDLFELPSFSDIRFSKLDLEEAGIDNLNFKRKSKSLNPFAHSKSFIVVSSNGGMKLVAVEPGTSNISFITSTKNGPELCVAIPRLERESGFWSETTSSARFLDCESIEPQRLRESNIVDGTRTSFYYPNVHQMSEAVPLNIEQALRLQKIAFDKSNVMTLRHFVDYESELKTWLSKLLRINSREMRKWTTKVSNAPRERLAQLWNDDTLAMFAACERAGHHMSSECDGLLAAKSKLEESTLKREKAIRESGLKVLDSIQQSADSKVIAMLDREMRRAKLCRAVDTPEYNYMANAYLKIQARVKADLEQPNNE